MPVLRTSAGSVELNDRVTPRHRPIAEIARVLEPPVTGELVRQWTLGISKPRAEHRVQLERLLGIPASSWDEPALTELPAAEPAPKKRRTRTAA